MTNFSEEKKKTSGLGRHSYLSQGRGAFCCGITARNAGLSPSFQNDELSTHLTLFLSNLLQSDGKVKRSIIWE